MLAVALFGSVARTALIYGRPDRITEISGDDISDFTRGFVEVLEENQEILTANRLYDALSDRSVRAGRPAPRYVSLDTADHAGGDFIFVPPPATRSLKVQDVERARAEVTPSSEVMEQVFWDLIKEGLPRLGEV